MQLAIYHGGCLLQVETESSPWKLFACSLNCVTEAKERGSQELDRLKECEGKYLPKDCFPSQFTEQSRRRMCVFQRVFFPSGCSFWLSCATLIEVGVKKALSISGSLWWITLQPGYLNTVQLSLVHSLYLICSCICSCGRKKGVEKVLHCFFFLCLEVFLWCPCKLLLLPL